jgi:hypothetical protein
MHRIGTLVSILALAAPAATSAVPPEHLTVTAEPEEFTVPAGELCDFEYGQLVYGTLRGTRFYDQDGVRVRAIWHEDVFVEHRNLDTGAILQERYHDQLVNDLIARTQTFTGNFWHLRDEDGRLVLASGGRYVIDLDTGELLDATPAVPTFADTVCTLLGGAPASSGE